MQKNKNTRKKVAIIISVILLCIMVFIIGMMNTQTKKKEILKKQKLLEQTGANTANESIANMPKLSQGMVPVKWNGTNWVITTVQDTEWYDYQNKQWANVMLQAELTYDENKNVTSSGSMYVWIPRYAYQITHGYHTNEVGEIQTVFLQGNSNKKWMPLYSKLMVITGSLNFQPDKTEIILNLYNGENVFFNIK